MPGHAPPRARRRAGAALGACVAVLCLAACFGGDEPPPPPTTPAREPTAEELAQAHAVRLTRELLEELGRARTTKRAQRGLVADLQALHEERLEALGASAAGSPDPAATSSGSAETSGAAEASGTADPSPAAVGLSTIAEHEHAAAAEILAEVPRVEPGLATLLSRLAAGFAVDADLLAAVAGDGALPDVRAAEPDPTSTGSPAPADGTAGAGSADPTTSAPSTTTSTTGSGGGAAWREALAAEIAGEHAAVYGFGLIAGRMSGPSNTAVRDRALASFVTHTTLRDELERDLLAADGDPPASADAYDVGAAPRTAAQARVLAAEVETRLTATAAQTIGVADGALRTEAAQRMIAAARRAAAWGGAPVALPGAGQETTSQPSLSTSAATTSR